MSNRAPPGVFSSSSGSGNPPIGAEGWESIRSNWSKNKNSIASSKRSEIKGKVVDVEEVIDSLFASGSDGRLPVTLPLGQMVDILTDFWEADGFFE